jgi:hypothetical protein
MHTSNIIIVKYKSIKSIQTYKVSYIKVVIPKSGNIPKTISIKSTNFFYTTVIKSKESFFKVRLHTLQIFIHSYTHRDI